MDIYVLKHPSTLDRSVLRQMIMDDPYTLWNHLRWRRSKLSRFDIDSVLYQTIYSSIFVTLNFFFIENE